MAPFVNRKMMEMRMSILENVSDISILKEETQEMKRASKDSFLLKLETIFFLSLAEKIGLMSCTHNSMKRMGLLAAVTLLSHFTTLIPR